MGKELRMAQSSTPPQSQEQRVQEFVSEFNERTKDMRGVTIPVVITIFSDRSFTFETKSSTPA